MSQTPAISVIVPIYNVERYVKLCINSILKQTFQDFEVIIVDDASPDNSYNICQKLYGSNEKVRIIRHEKNLGLGPARNTGIANARGKYIYFVDSDDAILPNALEILYTTAEKSGADVVHTSRYYETTQDDDKPLEVSKFTVERENHQGVGFLNPNVFYRWENCWRHWRDADGIRSMAWLNFCRREIFENFALHFEPIISEDELFSLELLTYVKKFFTTDKIVYVYRCRAGSIMKLYNYERIEKALFSLRVINSKMKNLFSHFSNIKDNETFQERFIWRAFNNFVGNHIRPFYKNGLNNDLDAVVTKSLKDMFGDDMTFIKYFLHNENISKVQLESLSVKSNDLIKNYNQLVRRNKLANVFLSEQAAILKLFDKMKVGTKKIFLVGTPRHGNLGDQAIVLAEYFLLTNIFPDHQIIDVPYPYLTGTLREIFYGLGFKKYVQSDDLIVMHGGGNLGNLWANEENFRLSVIKNFPENKIIIFPQSIHFTDNAEGQRQLSISKQIYNAHPNLHLMLRDENSFNKANEIFPNVHKYFMPDVVTALLGIIDNANSAREGVLFILRRDKEKVRDDSNIKKLQEFLTLHKIPFSATDTVISEIVYAANRQQKILDMLMKIRQSRLVITDRFHGVVFSYITRTPVMAFKSFDTKISSGIKWFKDIPSIFYGEDKNFSQIENFIVQAYNKNLPSSNLPNFVGMFAETLQAIHPIKKKLNHLKVN